MAVVSISKIQHRRGQKLQGSGLPQLASGELGWAIDTRELYIGNGAVSEGAPSVGNTKVLTEYDDILTLAAAYTYSRNTNTITTGPSSSAPIARTIQDRLDDIVSVRSFGAYGDGSDQTQELQRAINELFLGSTETSLPARGVELRLPAGTYKITDTLYVPPYATLVGDGLGKTIIQQDSEVPIFRSVNGTSTAGSPASDSSSTAANQAQKIFVQGVTLYQTQNSAGMLLETCRDTVFDSVEIKGVWPQTGITDSHTAVHITSQSSAAASQKILFRNCVIHSFMQAGTLNQNVDLVQFENCEFATLNKGVLIGPGLSGVFNLSQTNKPKNNSITDSVFKNVSKQALYVERGLYNLSQNNHYRVVGTEQGAEQDAVFPVIEFEESSNRSDGDHFDRTQALITGGTNKTKYVPEVAGPANTLLAYEHTQELQQAEGVRVFRLPCAGNQTIVLDYTLASNSYPMTRVGTMSISTNNDASEVEIFDDFNYIGNSDYRDSITFKGNLLDTDNDSEHDTIGIKLTSNMPGDDVSVLKFTIQTKNIDTN